MPNPTGSGTTTEVTLDWLKLKDHWKGILIVIAIICAFLWVNGKFNGINENIVAEATKVAKKEASDAVLNDENVQKNTSGRKKNAAGITAVNKKIDELNKTADYRMDKHWQRMNDLDKKIAANAKAAKAKATPAAKKSGSSSKKSAPIVIKGSSPKATATPTTATKTVIPKDYEARLTKLEKRCSGMLALQDASLMAQVLANKHLFPGMTEKQIKAKFNDGDWKFEQQAVKKLAADAAYIKHEVCKNAAAVEVLKANSEKHSRFWRAYATARGSKDSREKVQQIAKRYYENTY